MMRREATKYTKWLTDEYNAKFKGKAKVRTGALCTPVDTGSPGNETPGHQKRQKVSSASFFSPRVAGAANDPQPVAPKTADKDTPHEDELAAYFALPQIPLETEWDGLKWWEENAAKFPNLSVMARQNLSCPASSATVERLFSLVDIAYSSKRQSSDPDTISDIIFTQMNVA